MRQKREEERDDEYVFYKDPKWKKRANCNKGTWTELEKALFINFLKENIRIF